VGVPKARVVEIGAGTGKFTELLMGREEEYEIVAVEPHREMREGLVRKALGGRVKALDGNAAEMAVEEGWGDACVAAQVGDVLSRGLGRLC
jgi:16S rRNA A1518/A1519 N6-dimethyltransferase RsmA/KsgA/DIM1 with predicted DNA glycosylase/AP lyase activity